LQHLILNQKAIPFETAPTKQFFSLANLNVLFFLTDRLLSSNRQIANPKIKKYNSTYTLHFQIFKLANRQISKLSIPRHRDKLANYQISPLLTIPHLSHPLRIEHLTDVTRTMVVENDNNYIIFC
ncbi:MAG: hypothetical protein RLZZ94_1701, partial [Bacteroidota bacterium]